MPLVARAHVYNNVVVCHAGLKLLQIISRTSEGWKQISAVNAGWQSIVAGTTQGDALVHNLPGAFNNPGTASFLRRVLALVPPAWCCHDNHTMLLHQHTDHFSLALTYRLECRGYSLPTATLPAEARSGQDLPVEHPGRAQGRVDPALAA
jgi:hypothetical protein